MYQIYVYIPRNMKELVKEAMFMAGAGLVGNYKRCSFEYEGTGQFEPMKGSDPHIGTMGQLEKVQEVKVEMVCQKADIKDVIAAMKAAHPYEEPAYGVIDLEEQ